MPWRPLPRIAFGVCTYPFQPSAPADLPLEIGDELYIIEQGGKDGSWYRGYLVAPPSLLAGLTSVKGQTLEARVFSGIFPRCCVEVREVLGEDRGPGVIQDDAAVTAQGKIEHADMQMQTNGVLTPTGSSCPTPTAERTLQNRKSLGKGEVAPAIPVVKNKTETRVANRGSRLAGQSELSPSHLPISPASMGARDANSPRPPAPVPMLKIGDETPTSAQEPLVDEIASCLREWHSTKLHELLLARRYSASDRMSTLVQRLDSSRRQLLHKVLTTQELGELRESTVWDLVNGNKMLSGEVIVRNPRQRGRIMTGDDSAIEITKLQSMMSLLHERPKMPAEEHSTHHLLVEIPQALGELSSAKTIAIHLASKAPGAPISPVSEVHAVNLSAQTGAAPEGNMKTLFTNLGSTDLGEGAGAGSYLYVVFKVIVNETLRNPVAQTHSSAVPRPSISSRQESYNTGNMGSMKAGRRSMMWAQIQRGRKDSDGADRSRPQTSEPELTEPKRSTSPPRPQTKEQKTVKRTVAAGIIRVDQILKQNLEMEQEIILWTPVEYATTEEQSETDAKWDNLLPELLHSATGEFRRYAFAKPVKVFIKAFKNPAAEALIKATPTLLQNISQTRRIGFAGAPSQPRSDIYLTLTEAFLPRHAFLSHPKSGTVPLGTQQGLANLQLTIEVRRSTGQRIDNCIYPSCNSQGHTAWRTTACERGEPWNLTIRLAIAPEDVPGSHIVMSIADLPGFPFALCWMPLWNDGAFIQDADHSLSLYQYDEYTSSIISGRGAYLALPWGSSRKPDNQQGPMASLRLRTFLCSTKYSQDPNLLGLLSWSQAPAGDLPSLLRRFLFVPEIEVVKLLNEVFDALFEILVDTAGSAEYENLVFHDLVFVLGILSDRRFKLAPLVDQYIEDRFKYPKAGLCLVHSFRRLLASPTDTETSRKLRATFKVGASIFKFISMACQQSQKQEKGRVVPGYPSQQAMFVREIKYIFQSLESLMKNPAAILIGTKTLLVQHIHSWLPELVGVMNPSEILELATGFIDSCSGVQGKLILFKLVLIINLTQMETLNQPDCKRSLLTNTVRWLAPYWGRTDAVTEQWREQVRLCCSVVAAQVNDLGEEACEYIPKLVASYRAIQVAPRQPKKALSLLFPTAHPFQSRPIANETTDFDETLVEISAVLAAITSLPVTINLEMAKPELAEFLFSALQVYISILDGAAYPPSWLSVHIYHHRSTIQSLEKLSSILMDSFLPHPDEADQFNTELWRAFFDALLKLVASDALALETFPEQKRRAVWKIAGDVRELGADLLRRSWEAIGWETSPEDKAQYGLEKLGGYQVQYVPGLVGPIVELCLSVHEGLRIVAIQILQTMIISEWTLSQDLSLIQAEIIDCLDHLFKTKHINESVLQKLFIQELVEMFQPIGPDPEDGLLPAIKVLVSTLDELLDLLVAVHNTEASGEAFHIMDTLRLMEYLKDMQKEDIFIRYVHQLANIQADARNHAEAGLALRLHADLYDWDPLTVVENLRDPYFPSQTPFERKEQLYFQMIKHYEDGQSWDNALGCYMELADQYEHNVFDFAKLARAQRAMATIYESISKGQRENPRYFRVIYKGLGFPISLRDKQFIFQGTALDRVSTFIDRLQQQHPSASMHTSGSTDEEVEGQFIYVYPVSPQKDLLHPIFQRAKVAQSVRRLLLALEAEHLYLDSQTKEQRRRSQRPKPEEDGLHNGRVLPDDPTAQRNCRRRQHRALKPAASHRTHNAEDGRAGGAGEAGARRRRIPRSPPSPKRSCFRSTRTHRPASQIIARSCHSLTSPTPRKSRTRRKRRSREPLDPLDNALRIALLDYAIVVRRCLGHFSRPAHQATKADLQQSKCSLISFCSAFWDKSMLIRDAQEWKIHSLLSWQS